MIPLRRRLTELALVVLAVLSLTGCPRPYTIGCCPPPPCRRTHRECPCGHTVVIETTVRRCEPPPACYDPLAIGNRYRTE